jgi:hypothetical protein
MNAFWNAYQNAFQAGEQRNQAMDGAINKYQNRQAGNAMIGGDMQAAQNVFLGAGRIDEGMAIQRQQQAQQQAAEQARRQAEADKRAAEDQQWQTESRGRERTGWEQDDKELARGEMLRHATGLRQLEPGQREQAFIDEAGPALIKLGIPPQAIDRVLADGHLSDEELDSFIVTLGGQAEKVDPLADLKRRELEARIAYTESGVPLREAQADRAARPPAGRGGGGGGMKLPAGFVLDPAP